MLSDKLDSADWSAAGDTPIEIPVGYKEAIEQLRYEVVVFTPKREYSFQCRGYGYNRVDQTHEFFDVFIDSSIKDYRNVLVTTRLSYHPVIYLCNVGFTATPIPQIKENPVNS